MYALAHSEGPRLAGAFMRNVQTLLVSPAEGGTNTSSTVTLQAKTLDPLRRAGAVQFQLDRSGTFSSPALQTSGNVNVTGWADTPASWASTAIGNGLWYYRGRATLVQVGSGAVVTGRYTPTPISFTQQGGAGIPRSLYLYVNKGIQTVAVSARALYLYVNKAIYEGVIAIESRALYLYVNRAMYEGVIAIEARALYLYIAPRDGEVFPYLNHISPEEQYIGGQVELFGDGFGQYLDATLSATLSVSSTNGGNVAGFAVDRDSPEWQSTSGAAAWLRLTWGAARRIVAIVLTGAGNGTQWGRPRFRFDDASSQDGATDVPVPNAYRTTSEYPVGADRTIYWLATPKDSTYVEIAIASGGTGTNRGLREVWVFEEISPAQNAENARAVLNLGLPSELTMGIVGWQTRSPNLWPANSGVALIAAATVTVPAGAESGLVYVEETI